MKKNLIRGFLLLCTLLWSVSCQSGCFKRNEDQINTFYSYNGDDIWYSDEGVGDTFIFIHGFASASYTWRYLANYYKESSRVICIDLQGFGNSAKPEESNYTLEIQADLVRKFIIDKELTNVTLVGHSFGGSVALSSYIFADELSKNRITRMILIDPAAYNQPLPYFISMLRVPVVNQATLELVPTEINSEVVLKELLYNDDLITQEMVDTYSYYLRGNQAQNALKKCAMNMIPSNIEEITSRYSTIDLPTLIIWGEMDSVIPISYGESLDKALLNSQLINIKNCGHMPQEEKPIETINAINKFLAYFS